jgi:hypothetical protein
VKPTTEGVVRAPDVLVSSLFLASHVSAHVSIPSEFSIILGFMPSMSATAELVVPRSIPMTGPLTFSSLSIFSAYVLLNDELMGDLYAEERRVEAARGAA